MDPNACKKLIVDALWKHGGRVTAAASMLGISRPFFWFLLRKHDLAKVPREVRDAFKKRFAEENAK